MYNENPDKQHYRRLSDISSEYILERKGYQIPSGAKLKTVVRGVHKPNFLYKQTLIRSNLQTNRTFLEFCQHVNVDEYYRYSANVLIG